MEWLKIRFASEMEVINEESPTMPIKKMVDVAGSKLLEICAKYVGKIQNQVLIVNSKKFEMPF